MDLPLEIASEIRRRIEHYRDHGTGGLSRDGKALRVDGSIGYDCWMSPDGDVYMETYDITTQDAPVVDRSRRAQVLVHSRSERERFLSWSRSSLRGLAGHWIVWYAKV